MRRGIAASLALITLACEPQTRADALVTSSDPELAQMAAELLPDLAARAGLSLTRPVRIERRTRGELERYLEFKLEEELTDADAEAITATYALLGLVSDDLDLKAVLKDVYLEQVAGFYDPDSTMLFVIDDQPAALQETLLVHELVHAIQDQSADLDAITDPSLGNDRRLAAQAAIEGHATLIMFELLMARMQRRSVDVTEIPSFTDRIRPALEAAQGQSPALAAAPRIIQESLLFPYIGGASFVDALWKARRGRPAPFDELLPRSTEQILHPESFVGESRDQATPVRLEAVGGASPIYSDGLGELEVRILLETHLGAAGADLSTGWDGDRYALYEAPDGGRSLVWVSVWDDAASRDRFVAALGTALVGLPAPSVLRGADIDGRPGAVLEIGAPPPTRASLDGGAGE
ncbi:MAG: hypothetical protein BMS9Abin29_1698 [Gemmatimonadota bacterium]|nr:MAG: hypothetical protein BMS9Abin29_1698 [Gemmatimonadota bacterium]